MLIPIISSDRDGSESDMDMSASDSDAPTPTATSKSKKIKSAAEVIDSDEEAGGEGADDDQEVYRLEGVYKNSADKR